MAPWSTVILVSVLVLTVRVQSRCNGGDSCCKYGNCHEGEGDCDLDSDCYGNLRCGTDNCRNTWWTGDRSSFDSTDDCCVTDAGYILVTGGLFTDQSSEVFGQGVSCNSFELPENGMYQHFGYTRGGVNLVCFGKRKKGCYKLSLQSKKWENYNSYDQWRWGVGTAEVDFGFWIIGGWYYPGIRNSSLYLPNRDKNWVEGRDIPGKGLINGCMAKLDSSRVIVIGGDYDSEQVKVFNTTAMTWTNWTSLGYGGFSEGACISTDDGVLLTGGYTNSEADSKSILVTFTGSYHLVGNLTVERVAHKMVKWDNKILAIGGRKFGQNGPIYHTSIDEWVPSTKSWKLSQYKLREGRSHFGVQVTYDEIGLLCP